MSEKKEIVDVPVYGAYHSFKGTVKVPENLWGNKYMRIDAGYCIVLPSSRCAGKIVAETVSPKAVVLGYLERGRSIELRKEFPELIPLLESLNIEA